MLKADVAKVPSGLYRIHWKSGGTSLAAVGVSSRGARWLAPTNWTNAGEGAYVWRRVERVEAIAIPARPKTSITEFEVRQIVREEIAGLLP